MYLRLEVGGYVFELWPVENEEPPAVEDDGRGVSDMQFPDSVVSDWEAEHTMPLGFYQVEE